MARISESPGAGVSDDRGHRLLTALQTLLLEGKVVISVSDLARRAQVTKPMATLGVKAWTERKWLQPIKIHGKNHFLIRSATPGAPSDAALDALAILQSVNASDYEFGRLTYGYASALSFLGLSELIVSEIYIFQSVPAIRAPKIPEFMPFQHTTKTPRLYASWEERPIYLLRRNPNMLRPYQRAHVSYQGVTVPCTTPIKTLIDCWVRPDLAGGADRMVDAWHRHLDATPLVTDTRNAIVGGISAILRDSAWPAMRDAFALWFKAEFPSLMVESL